MDTSYLTSAQKANQLPQLFLPEVAFIGRSNSGKSSLLNALLERKNLARSSSTPGRTQMINFFNVSLNKDQSMIFADLPGYGFNVAAKEIRKFWDELMVSYTQRANICAFIYLRDIRREFEDFEYEFMQELAAKKDLILVLTKTDKTKASALGAMEKKLSAELASKKISLRGLYPVSNLNKKGIENLRQAIFLYMPAVPPAIQ